MHYKYENGFKVQFVGSQMFGQDYNEYKIMVSSQMKEVKLIVTWIESVTGDFEIKDEEKTAVFQINQLDYLFGYSLSLDIYTMDIIWHDPRYF
uniref:Neur_chan_LBD domain-containing protein n=1 Tax=Meloidogyne hapla TaxID=6305 RepID=A0A1I8BWP3_MELHA